MRPAIEERADALNQLLSELQDGNAWDSTISLLADYADLVRDLMQDRAALVAEIVKYLHQLDAGRDESNLIGWAANRVQAEFGGQRGIVERLREALERIAHGDRWTDPDSPARIARDAISLIKKIDNEQRP